MDSYLGYVAAGLVALVAVNYVPKVPVLNSILSSPLTAGVAYLVIGALLIKFLDDGWLMKSIGGGFMVAGAILVFRSVVSGAFPAAVG